MQSCKQILSTRNGHLRDANVKFHVYGHKYEILTDARSKYTSVTTWNHSHFPKFDADKVIANIMKGKNWGPDNKYWGQTPEQIKQGWKLNADSVAGAGTKLHERIEMFMNDNRLQFEYSNKDLYDMYIAEQAQKQRNKNYDESAEAPEWNYFIDFVRDHNHLIPYRTEWMIYDEDLKIAGSIDMVFKNEDGTLSIYDWKRTKEISKVNNWNQYATNGLIGHLHDTNFWHYSLQLNTYKAILEKNYGFRIRDLRLVRLHPDADNYELIEVPILEEEINNLFMQRMSELNMDKVTANFPRI